MAKSEAEKVKVAIVGMGTVGCGVARLLLDHGDRVIRHAGKVLWLEEVVVRDLQKPRDVELPQALVPTTDLTKVYKNKEIKVVAHLVGGLEPARTIMIELLKSGKDVVTANKALLAEHGPELFDLARELGRSIAFEASVAGGVPIIANISQCLSANQITALRGILNGTSNFIVSQMDQGDDYASALKEAQRLGYAEADPTLDVDGSDAAQKLAILAHLAFGARVHWRDIPREGIDKLDVADLRYAKELGYRIKLIASARLVDGGLEVHVAPTLVKIGQPLAEVQEAYNAISVQGDAVGHLFFHGRGAGQMPTASAVVADMIDTAVGRTAITFRTLNLWSQQAARVHMNDPKQLKGRYYLRFTVEDHPGVLAAITGALGRHNISIASVIQHEPSQDATGQVVPLVIMTHNVEQGAVTAAVAEIDRLLCTRPGSVRLRVLK